jgi:hypothetical protein
LGKVRADEMSCGILAGNSNWLQYQEATDCGFRRHKAFLSGHSVLAFSTGSITAIIAACPRLLPRSIVLAAAALGLVAYPFFHAP